MIHQCEQNTVKSRCGWADKSGNQPLQCLAIPINLDRWKFRSFSAGGARVLEQSSRAQT